MSLKLKPLFFVPEDSEVEMKCEFALLDLPAASGDTPKPDVLWRHDDSPIDDDEDRIEQSSISHPKFDGTHYLFECQLKIQHVQRTDEGTYCCRVKSSASPEPLSTSTLLLVPLSPFKIPNEPVPAPTSTTSKRPAEEDANSDVVPKRSTASPSDVPPGGEYLSGPSTHQSLLQALCEPRARPLGVNCTLEAVCDAGVTQAADTFEASGTVLQSGGMRHIDQHKRTELLNWFGLERAAFNDMPLGLSRKRALLSIEDLQVLYDCVRLHIRVYTVLILIRLLYLSPPPLMFLQFTNL